MKRFLCAFFTPRYNSLFLGVTCILLISGAFFFQYGLGLTPCVLCLWERIPHYIGIILGLSAFALYPKHPKLAVTFHTLLILGIAVSGGLSVFHVGVEQEFWTFNCQDTIDGASTEEIMAQLYASPAIDCKDIQWSLFGISITGYNFLVCFGLVCSALITAVCARRRCQQNNA